MSGLGENNIDHPKR